MNLESFWKSWWIIREFCTTSGNNCNKQNSVTRYRSLDTSYRSAKMLWRTFVLGYVCAQTPLGELIVFPQTTIITITFCFDNLWKRKLMALDKPGKLGNFFLLLCSQPEWGQNSQSQGELTKATAKVKHVIGQGHRAKAKAISQCKCCKDEVVNSFLQQTTTSGRQLQATGAIMDGCPFWLTLKLTEHHLVLGYEQTNSKLS